jgi:hypothetical protein
MVLYSLLSSKLFRVAKRRRLGSRLGWDDRDRPFQEELGLKGDGVDNYSLRIDDDQCNELAASNIEN